jgi:hypothetical protein
MLYQRKVARTMIKYNTEIGFDRCGVTVNHAGVQSNTALKTPYQPVLMYVRVKKSEG